VVAVDCDGVYVSCWRGSLAVPTAHKVLGEGELGVQVEVEAAAPASAPELSPSAGAAGSGWGPGASVPIFIRRHDVGLVGLVALGNF